MIQDVTRGFQIQDLDFFPSRIRHTEQMCELRQNECGLLYPYLSISSVVTPTWMALAASSKT